MFLPCLWTFILTSIWIKEVEALVCSSCTYISLEGSDQLIPGSDDDCITNNAPSVDCGIYSTHYGDVTQCLKYDIKALIYTTTGDEVLTQFIRRQCDIGSWSTQDNDYCEAVDDVIDELEDVEFTDTMENLIGTIDRVLVDGDSCRCDSDECNSALSGKPLQLRQLIIIALIVVIAVLL